MLKQKIKTTVDFLENKDIEKIVDKKINLIINAIQQKVDNPKHYQFYIDFIFTFSLFYFSLFLQLFYFYLKYIDPCGVGK